MTQINTLNTQGLLAMAAYADGMLSADLVNIGMTSIQAADFISNWTAIDRYTDASGVSATVFQENATGKKYLAIRGTESPGDFNADYILALGFPPYLNPQFIQLRTQVASWISNGTLPSGFAITGHSLGGYLAAAIGTWFSGQSGEIYLYNAPGIGGPIGNALDAFRAAFGFSNTALVPGITSIRGSAGVSLISGLGAQLAPPLFIETESRLNPIDNHSIVGLTDSLAVYALFAQLDPALNSGGVDAITSILKASSNIAANSLEAVLAALGKIYGKTYSAIETDRNDFYTHLYDLQAALGTGTVVSLVATSRDTLVTEAQRTDAEGIAYRYALKELNPFVVVGADYTPHNQNGELDLYDPATGTGTLTTLYLQDRAAFLAWKNKTYTEDTDVGRVYDGSAWHFKDEAGGAELWVGNPYDVKRSPQLRHLVFGGAGSDTLTGGDNADHLYGGGGNDVLSGGKGSDYLEGQLGDDSLKGEDGRDVLIGGAGNDTLDGGKGADRLEGGAGSDIYLLTSANKANDVIRDSDGLGIIMLDGSVLDGGDYQSPGVWQKGTTTYTFTPDATGRGTLTVTSDAGNITIENFAAGDLGIALPDAPTVTPPPPEDRVIQGDLAPIDFDPATPGVQMQVDELGNVITDPAVNDPDRIDTLYDSTGNDKLISAGGNDILHADRGGHDWLDTGSGDDLATAGAGNDTVEGVTGADRLFGGAGDDQLYSARAEAIDSAIAGGEMGSGSGLKGDWLDGGEGRDTLVGSLDNDALLGGEGNDILIGGQGDDFLMGDETADTWSDFRYLSVNPDWRITREVSTRADEVTLYKRIYADASSWVDGAGGADVLYGGAGDDWVFGQLGNDVLLGGIGQDVLFGSEGNDLLYGQEGDDVLSGDSIQDSDGSGIPGGLHGADCWMGERGMTPCGAMAATTRCSEMLGTDWIWPERAICQKPAMRIA